MSEPFVQAASPVRARLSSHATITLKVSRCGIFDDVPLSFVGELKRGVVGVELSLANSVLPDGRRGPGTSTNQVSRFDTPMHCTCSGVPPIATQRFVY